MLFGGIGKNDGIWHYGGIFHQTDLCGDKCDRWFILDGTDAQDHDIGYADEVIPETVVQYTGLTDKNDKKIFEGDAVKTKYGRICYVVWMHGRSMFDLDPAQTMSNAKTKAPDDFDLWNKKNLEVVGNVFDGYLKKS